MKPIIRLNRMFNTLGSTLLASALFSFSFLHAAEVDLEWDPNPPVDAVVGYNMYRSLQAGSGYVRLNTPDLIPGISYTDNTAAEGETYYYVCTAVNGDDLESGFSNEVPYTVPIVVTTCLGDANMDGTRNILDVLLLYDHIAERALLEGQALDNADCNEDGSVNILDVLVLYDHIVERVSLPNCS